MFGRQIGYIEKRDGIGQTPYSYDHNLVFFIKKRFNIFLLLNIFY